MHVACVQLHWAKTLEYDVDRTRHHIQAAANCGARVVLFPEANLTSYYFPYLQEPQPRAVEEALDKSCEAAAKSNIWVIVGTSKGLKIVS